MESLSEEKYSARYRADETVSAIEAAADTFSCPTGFETFFVRFEHALRSRTQSAESSAKIQYLLFIAAPLVYVCSPRIA